MDRSMDGWGNKRVGDGRSTGNRVIEAVPVQYRQSRYRRSNVQSSSMWLEGSFLDVQGIPTYYISKGR